MNLYSGKRMLAGLLTILLAAGPGLPAKASETDGSGIANGARKSGDFYYEVLDDNTAVITDYEGTAAQVIVPDILDGHRVSRIGSEAFFECHTMKSIQLPEGLVSIEDGAGAFKDCSSLSSVVFGKNLTYIGKYAFMGCEKLGSVNIPDRVSEIGDSAFQECKKLNSVRLPKDIKKLGEGVFENCVSLKSITIPGSVEEVPHRGFFSCTSLKTLIIENGVGAVCKHAFKECDSLVSVKIPGSVKVIEEFAFYDCDKLSDVELEEGIQELEGGIFGKCWNLKKLRIPASVTKLGYAITHAGTKLEVYEGTAGLEYAKKFFKEFYQEYEVLKKPKSLSKAKVSSIAKQTYTGKSIKPSLTVKYGSEVLKSGTDYAVKYSNNKAVGIATVTVTGKGSYAGSITKTFTICPKSTTLSKLTAKSKGFTVKWKKQSSQTTGYEIQYSTNSKFTKKTTEVKTINKNKTTSVKILKLKSSKKYYVRIRTYKMVTVNGKSKKIYSSWSKAKTIRTKK